MDVISSSVTLAPTRERDREITVKFVINPKAIRDNETDINGLIRQLFGKLKPEVYNLIKETVEVETRSLELTRQ